MLSCIVQVASILFFKRNGLMNTFICYERCTTCKKAQKWLDTKGVEYKVRPIKEAEWEETVL